MRTNKLEVVIGYIFLSMCWHLKIGTFALKKEMDEKANKKANKLNKLAVYWSDFPSMPI